MLPCIMEKRNIAVIFDVDDVIIKTIQTISKAYKNISSNFGISEDIQQSLIGKVDNDFNFKFLDANGKIKGKIVNLTKYTAQQAKNSGIEINENEYSAAVRQEFDNKYLNSEIFDDIVSLIDNISSKVKYKPVAVSNNSQINITNLFDTLNLTSKFGAIVGLTPDADGYGHVNGKPKTDSTMKALRTIGAEDKKIPKIQIGDRDSDMQTANNLYLEGHEKVVGIHLDTHNIPLAEAEENGFYKKPIYEDKDRHKVEYKIPILRFSNAEDIEMNLGSIFNSI